MLHTVKAMAARYNRYMTHMGRLKAREVLLRSSDRLLEDTGISRELLEQGVSAWPWRTSNPEHVQQSIAYKTHTTKQNVTKQAVKELAGYSDSELHDLGITRGTINEAVRFGRDGIERQGGRKVA